MGLTEKIESTIKNYTEKRSLLKLNFDNLNRGEVFINGEIIYEKSTTNEGSYIETINFYPGSSKKMDEIRGKRYILSFDKKNRMISARYIGGFSGSRGVAKDFSEMECLIQKVA